MSPQARSLTACVFTLDLWFLWRVVNFPVNFWRNLRRKTPGTWNCRVWLQEEKKMGLGELTIFRPPPPPPNRLISRLTFECLHILAKGVCLYLIFLQVLQVFSSTESNYHCYFFLHWYSKLHWGHSCPSSRVVSMCTLLPRHSRGKAEKSEFKPCLKSKRDKLVSCHCAAINTLSFLYPSESYSPFPP